MSYDYNPDQGCIHHGLDTDDKCAECCYIVLDKRLAAEVERREGVEKERDDLKKERSQWLAHAKKSQDAARLMQDDLNESIEARKAMGSEIGLIEKERDDLKAKLEAALAREAMLREALMSLVIEAKPIFRFCKQRGDELLSFPWAIRNADKILNEGQGE